MKRGVLIILLLAGAYMANGQQIYSANNFENVAGTAWDPLLEIDGDPVSGIITDQFDNGKPRLWKEVRNGRAHGLWMEWYENGNLKYKAEWKEGKGQGYWRYFYENGQLRSEEIYEADVNQGIGLHYHQNGKLKKKTFHLEGKKHGKWIIYSAEGQPLAFEIFNEGELIEKGDSEKN